MDAMAPSYWRRDLSRIMIEFLEISSEKINGKILILA